MTAALILTATLTATPTPDAFDQGYAAGHESALTRGAYQIVPPGAWVVTSTATASPTATRQPTANAEATCVAVGHAWTSNWREVLPVRKNGDNDWPTKAHLEITVQVTEPDHDPAWMRVAQRCRRCGLWRSMGKEWTE
jgi:hypothetical protein